MKRGRVLFEDGGGSLFPIAFSRFARCLRATRRASTVAGDCLPHCRNSGCFSSGSRIHNLTVNGSRFTSWRGRLWSWQESFLHRVHQTVKISRENIQLFLPLASFADLFVLDRPFGSEVFNFMFEPLNVTLVESENVGLRRG
jgi:hypothetical protein